MGTAHASATGAGWTVRTRIVIVITVVAAIGLLSVGAAVYIVERARILAAVDNRLEAAQKSARALVAVGTGDTPWASSTAALEATVTRINPDDNTGALGVIDGVAAFIPGVPLDVDLRSAPGFVEHVSAAAAQDPVIGTYAEEGVAWRYLAAPIAIDGSPEPSRVLFVTAYDLDGELSEFDAAARVYLIAAAVVLIVIAASAGLVAARLLQPLRRMRETAARVSARSLAERLPVEGNDDVSALAATMNDMLDRLDDALGAQRMLLSDVGHELKTPVTIVSGHLDVMDVDNPVDVRETRALVLDELARMGRLVQDLA
ncbi:MULTISPECIES: HAMP domain-containing sensor histidine kinase [Microbacterium]|uniref:HAMP domain-containing protein n=1 Tax=Microbacterium TaxID=33882 RepID=UPI0027D8B6F0|nr:MULTISPECIES: HAMP domain-containing sensor histidine kinase [Microbacterium]